MSRSEFEQQQCDFDSWCEKWEQAQKDGVFDNADTGPRVTPMQGAESFYGPIDTVPSDAPADADAQYWNNLHKLADPHSYKDPVVLAEAHGTKEEKKKVALGVADSPNPIRATSVGTDQDIDPGPLGLTFTPEDLEKLSEMKIKLHDLQGKLNNAEGLGKSGKQYETKIQSLKNQIDELSTMMTHGIDSLPDGD